MRYYRLIIITFLLNLSWTSTHAQQYIFDAELLTTEDGLANLYTTPIYQDSNGFIWIGTKYGLNRYDGYSFKSYTEEKNGLKAVDKIISLFEDEKGNIWIIYYIEDIIYCDIFDPLTKQVTPLETYFENKLPFDAKDLYGITKVNSTNLISFFTKKGELYFYQENRFEKIAEGLPSGIVHIKFNVIVDDKDIWVGLREKIIHINWSGEILENIDLQNHINYFGLGEDGQLWLNLHQPETESSVLLIKEKNKPEFEPLLLKKENATLKNLRRIILGKNGLCYADFQGQLHVFDSKGEWLFNFHSLLGDHGDAGIIDYSESDDLVWFTTSTGLIKTSVRETFFHLIQDNTQSMDYRGITEDEAGNIYFLNKNLHRWNPLTGKLDQFLDFTGSFDVLYNDDVVWISNYSDFALGQSLNLKDGKQLFYNHEKARYAYSFLESKMQKKYFVGHQGGLSFLDLNQAAILPFEQYNNFEKLKYLDVFHFHKNKTGIWLATNGGVFLMTEEQGILQHFDKASGHLPFDYINHIHEDSSGVFWLASRGGGLIRWEPVLSSTLTTTYKQFTTEDGLSNDYLYAVYEDNHKRLWIPSDKGLMEMDKNTFEIHTYTTQDGLPHNEFNLTSHHQSKDGSLYFGGLGGLITFHPNDIPIDFVNETPMKFIGYQLLKEGDEEPTDLTSFLVTSDEIVITPSDKLFELTFSLLDFDKPENHLYAYQIEGYDNNWRTIQENFLRITHLPYGNYTLKIKGQNIKRGWSKEELELEIFMLRPFYLQWWFFLLSVFLLATLVIVFIKKREANLKKDRELLEEEVRKRTQTISAQAEELKQLDKVKTRFFSNITHEFRTPLTLIIGPLEQVIENQPPPTIFKRRLNGVLNNAKHLLALINQMLDLSKLESGQMQTEVIKGDIINYTRQFVKRFEPLIEKRGNRFKFVSSQENWETHFDKDKWDKIIYNLLSNALKFTPKGEAVQLSLMKTVFKDKEAIRLDVRDTGVGIKKDQLDQIFNRFYQADDSSKRAQEGTGIGLALVKELVELQGGEVWVSSRVNEGTSFEIYLPVLGYEKGRVEQNLELPALPILNEIAEKTAKETLVPTSKKEGKLELLIIEDNEEIREYIQYCLDTSKYNVTEAVNGEDGVLKAQSIIPDLIISDVMMPRKNGFEVVKEVRGNLATSHIPIILLTAKSSLESRLEGLKRGADAYLTKPFSPQELALRIQKLIELRQILQQRYQNNLPTNGDETYQKEDAFITQLRAYILENIDKTELGVNEIGRNFGMSRVHLYRKLKALTNQSTSVLVRQIRLERAKELLQEGKLNISEITYQTGFASISYFSRSFKKAYGVSPSEM